MDFQKNLKTDEKRDKTDGKLHFFKSFTNDLPSHYSSGMEIEGSN